jgi:LacI family transcriptional regulator
MARIPKVILWIENSREYGRQLLRGISQYASLYGPWNFYTAQPFYYNESGQQRHVMSIIRQIGADGIIMRESADVEEVKQSGVPAIVSTYTREKFEGLVSIVGDCEGAGRLAAEHLLARGFKHFAYCGLDDMYWSHDRRKGFEQRLSQSGYGVHVYQQPRSKLKRLWRNEQAIMLEWLKQLPNPIGLMACTDDRAQNVSEACKVAGIQIPDEIAIIGVDNDELACGLSNPPLSSVALNANRAGYEAAAKLDALMKGDANTDCIIVANATHIAARQSTDILAIEDSEVATAVRYIRENVKKSIQISDVVESTVLSQRALQQRFRKVLGRTIHDEINRVRTDHICRILLDTKKSVSQIAVELDFSGDDHIARYFRKEKGMSPREYRVKFGNDIA